MKRVCRILLMASLAGLGLTLHGQGNSDDPSPNLSRATVGPRLTPAERIALVQRLQSGQPFGHGAAQRLAQLGPRKAEPRPGQLAQRINQALR